MKSLFLAFNVVFPLMLMMSIGYLLKKRRLTESSSLNVMNRMVFRVFLPMLLFLNIYSLKPEEAISSHNAALLIFTVTSILLATIILHIIISRIEKDKRKCGVMIQGIFRSNLILFGIPITASIYGEDRIGLVSLLAAFIVPVINVLAVIVLEVNRGHKVNIKSLITGIIKNPLIIAALSAFLLLTLHITIPEILLSPLTSMSKVATPLAFIVLGGSFHFDRLAVNRLQLFIVVIGKLILLPGIVLTLALILGFRGEAVVALIGAIASPTAVSSFTMAVEMDGDGELAGQIVVLTSAVCIVTIFMWVFLLRTMQLI